MSSSPWPALNEKTLAIIMGGGAGSRLFPLTKERSKPAVPLAGKYRLVDIPISNCINAGLRRIYVLTQFNSASLHRHISASYKFDNFSRSFVEILAAQQTPTATSWYQGTADAVRQNLRDFLQQGEEMLAAAGAKDIRRNDSRQAPGLDIHEMGGVRMGRDPKTSLLNRWNQLHACPNVFVTDGAAMASTGTQNPSLTFMALAARAANHAAEELKRGNL